MDDKMIENNTNKNNTQADQKICNCSCHRLRWVKYVVGLILILAAFALGQRLGMYHAMRGEGNFMGMGKKGMMMQNDKMPGDKKGGMMNDKKQNPDQNMMQDDMNQNDMDHDNMMMPDNNSGAVDTGSTDTGSTIETGIVMTGTQTGN